MAAYADRIYKPTRTLTEREQKALLKFTGEHRAGYRDHLMYALALATALRAHELLALNVGDVFREEGRARRRLRLRVFKRSNNNTDRQEVVLPDRLRAKLDCFMGWKGRGGESLEADAPLFLSRQGNRLSERQLRYRFKEWQERAGFERSFNFHALRHTACTNFYRATLDIRLTQRFARHASVMSTMRYTHCSDEELVAAVQVLG